MEGPSCTTRQAEGEVRVAQLLQSHPSDLGLEIETVERALGQVGLHTWCRYRDLGRKLNRISASVLKCSLDWKRLSPLSPMRSFATCNLATPLTNELFDFAGFLGRWLKARWMEAWPLNMSKWCKS